MSMWEIFKEQWATLPLPVSHELCSGKTYIVTGSNIGLGLETAKHLVRASAGRVILAVRSTTSGERARREIETETDREGVAEVWTLDLASYDSVRAFAKRAVDELDRLDALVENAAVYLDQWTTVVSAGVKEEETSVVVNDISTTLLGLLLLPKLADTARRFPNSNPRLVFVTSALGFSVREDLYAIKDNVLDGLNDPKKAIMRNRYALSKLVQVPIVHRLARLYPPEKTGVVINMVNPGLCKTGLTRYSTWYYQLYIDIIRVLMRARTAEAGSRTVLYGVAAGEETHGKYLSGCEIKEEWVPDWITDEDGKRIDDQIWKELVARLEEIEPGCIRKFS
ncbi:Short chain dehydrogenase atnD [Apiospora kogelbergensis]|uniref:Short chain dehydrogenase atnD n=2 Tax=Apiospora kogelbergensis TaxID=1337665 RepID=A0AAW0QAK0_9PEZI